MERDQKMMPLFTSQSHMPHWPRSSALSRREVATPRIWSASAALPACQWKAPPSRISTKRVMTSNTVTCMTLERQALSTSAWRWNTTRLAGIIAEVIDADEGILARGQRQRRHLPAVDRRICHEAGREHAGDIAAIEALLRRRAGGDVAQAAHHREDALLLQGTGGQDGEEIGGADGGRRQPEAAGLREIGLDALRDELRVKGGKPVLLRHVRGAAVGKLHQQRGAEQHHEQHDHAGDEPPQQPLGDGETETGGPGRGELQHPFPEKQLADLCLAQSLALDPTPAHGGKTCTLNATHRISPY